MTLSCLIVGGGIGGMASAIVLRRLGIAVDLIDIDPEWRVYGAGITITRPTLRAFRDLGVLDEIVAEGFAGDGIQVCEPDGTPLRLLPDPEMAGPPVPGSGGIMRPVLHRILAGHVRQSGASIRLGITIEAIDQDDAGATVRFSDGSSACYDFVIGADGIYSRTRALLFPDAPKPIYTGQTIWRLFAPRPADIVRRHFFLGGKVKVGLSPVSQTHLYMFLLENTPRRPIMPDASLHLVLRQLMEGYGGPIAALRARLSEDSPIVVRPLEAFLMPPPWYKGRVLLIGDACHPTTPQLASGAGLAVEDALVLGEAMAQNAFDVTAAFPAFMARRWSRCALVVENSMEIGRREQAGAPAAEQTILVQQSLAKLAEPI